MSKKELQEIIAEVQEDRIAASSSLSTQTRTIALGVLALAWLLLNGTEANLAARFSEHRAQLLWISGLSVLALLLDYLQYIFTLCDADAALKASLKASSADEAGYDENSWQRNCATTCFILKIVAGAGAATWILVVIARALI
jgi:hypothetical protein